MTKAKRAVELVKTALIVLLSVSAMLLAWRTGIFNDFAAAIPLISSVADLMRGATGTVEPGGATYMEAARPLSIVITSEGGRRFGVKYDTDLRNAVYERASSILGEALGSASAPVEISEEQWRASLSRPGVFFEYITPVRLSVLDRWLGVPMLDSAPDALIPDSASDVMLRRMFVAFGEDRSRLYYQDHDSGRFFGADTASAAGKAQELEIYNANDAMFAFETGIIGSENAPYMLIMPGTSHPDVRSAYVGSQELLLEIARDAFGHINEDFTTYPGGEGELVCVGTQFRITVYPDGRVLYRRLDGPPLDREAHHLRESEMIERARVLAADSVGATSGDAEVFFEIFGRGEGVYSVSFGYYIAGGRVFLPEDRHAAWVRFSDGFAMEAELNFRNFTFTGEYSTLLFERQALAAAGGEFMLSYSDAGAEILNPSWVKYGF